MHLDNDKFRLKISCEAFIMCKDEILLFKRSQNSRLFPGLLMVPGGHVDSGENPLVAAQREVLEETGVNLKTNQLKLKFIAFHRHLDRKEIWNVFGFSVWLNIKPKLLVKNSEGEPIWVKKSIAFESVKIFPPIRRYVRHSANKNTGLLYNSSTWENASLVEVLSETIDFDY